MLIFQSLPCRDMKNVQSDTMGVPARLEDSTRAVISTESLSRTYTERIFTDRTENGTSAKSGCVQKRLPDSPLSTAAVHACKAARAWCSGVEVTLCHHMPPPTSATAKPTMRASHLIVPSARNKESPRSKYASTIPSGHRR